MNGKAPRSNGLRLTRSARIGRTARLTVTLTALDDRLPLPIGADRTLLAWIQTLAFSSGFAAFHAVVEYLNAFGLGSGGRDYRVFRERLARLEEIRRNRPTFPAQLRPGAEGLLVEPWRM